mgnify:CR=1 FL=1
MNTFNRIAVNATASYYSFHTATLAAILTEREFNFIKDQLCKAVGNALTKYYREPYWHGKTSYNFLVNAKYGFPLVKMIKISGMNQRTTRKILITINPHAMLHKDDYPYVYISSKEDIRRSLEILTKFFVDVGINDWISLNILRVDRIDLSTNINLNDNATVEQYMKLLRQGNYPYSSRRVCIYSKSQRRKIPTPNSFTVKSLRWEFSVYNKQYQLKDNEKKYPKKEIEEAEGIIRFELRLKYPMIYTRAKRINLSTVNDILLHADLIAEDNFPRYLNKCYGTGAFVKKTEAQKIIESSQYKAPTKEIMCAMLNCCMQKRNLHIVSEIFSKKTYETLLKRFNTLGISPITIDSKNPLQRFEAPLYYIKNYNATTSKHNKAVKNT